MSRIASGFGIFLILLGLAGFALTYDAEHPHYTALIPTGFGVALVMLGALARNDRLRMHVMHAAALIGLIGFVVPGVMVVRRLIGPADPNRGPAALIEQSIMSLACLLFVGLCVKSFIDARRARAARSEAAP